MASMMLICCEGKTECEYFDILRRSVFRLPGYFDIRIEGEKGQHKKLIDHTVARRSKIAQEEGLAEDDVECWAVCDDDNMSITFAELAKYAEEAGVFLAFSRPQFESYLLQHFEQSKETSRDALYEKIGSHMGSYGDGKYNKADLQWLERMLMDKPKLVDIAITNSEQRQTQSASPFLTVQNLTRRLKSMKRH